MKSHIKRELLVACVFAGALSTAAGQGPSPGNVTGQGTVEIKRQPEILRIQVEVMGIGKDLKEALAKLKERRPAARKTLEKLGANTHSIVFGEAYVSTEKSDRRRQVHMMMIQQLRNQGVAPAKPKAPPPVIASVNLTAEFSLKAQGPEDLLMLANELQEKVKTADVGGMKELEKHNAQDEELNDPTALAAIGLDENQGLKQGEPVFLYVRKISEEEQASMLAGAFQKAKRDATRLAHAAGAELGSLHRLESTPNTGITSTSSSEMVGMPIDSYSTNHAALLERLSHEDQSGEAVGSQAGTVTYRVAISAAFILKTQAAK